MAATAAVAAVIGAGGGRGAFSIELSLEGACALVNHGFELIVIDVRERQVEDIAGTRCKGGEEAGEEDGVQYAFGREGMLAMC